MDKDLEQELERRGIRPGRFVRHFKYPERSLKAFFMIECFATHSETGVKFVIYRQLVSDHFLPVLWKAFFPKLKGRNIRIQHKNTVLSTTMNKDFHARLEKLRELVGKSSPGPWHTIGSEKTIEGNEHIAGTSGATGVEITPVCLRKANCCRNCKAKCETREHYYLCSLYRIYVLADNICNSYEREYE